MEELINKDDINIENKIYEVRGVQVMLDSDLAKIYQVETKRINEAVRNNPDKFPERFSFTLEKNEVEFLRSKFSTLEIEGQGKYSKYLPRAFTEQGVYMLATILRSNVATKVSIAIMDTFVKMRHYINYNNNILPNKVLLLEQKVDSNTKKISELFDKFSPNDIVKDKIFFDGELYDAYSMFIDLVNRAKKEVIIIDNYAGKELLDILKNIDKRIIIVSNNIKETSKVKYMKQYHNVVFIENNSFHDRYIIIDRNELYLCGSSFKDLGKKCFGISQMDKLYIEDIISRIKIA